MFLIAMLVILLFTLKMPRAKSDYISFSFTNKKAFSIIKKSFFFIRNLYFIIQRMCCKKTYKFSAEILKNGRKSSSAVEIFCPNSRKPPKI